MAYNALQFCYIGIDVSELSSLVGHEWTCQFDPVTERRGSVFISLLSDTSPTTCYPWLMFFVVFFSPSNSVPRYCTVLCRVLQLHQQCAKILNCSLQCSSAFPVVCQDITPFFVVFLKLFQQCAKILHRYLQCSSALPLVCQDITPFFVVFLKPFQQCAKILHRSVQCSSAPSVLHQ